MSRKSLIACLVALAVLVAGTGIAVAVLYSGMETDGKTVRDVADMTGGRLLSAVPSDAVMVGSFDGKGPFGSQMVVSLHYSGKLIPLYIYDSGKSSELPLPEVEEVIKGLESDGFITEYVPDMSGCSAVLASRSETLLRSSLRHLEKSMSVMDAPGFVQALAKVNGNDMLFISNEYSSYLVSGAFARKYSRWSGFVSRLCDWTALDLSHTDGCLKIGGAPVYDGDWSEYMSVLEHSASAASTVSEVLPSYVMAFATLPMSDIDGYVDAYRSYLDSRQAMQKNAAMRKSLQHKTGTDPCDLMKSLGVQEIASASFMAGSSLERINLIKAGQDNLGLLFKGLDAAWGKDYVPAVHPWPYATFISSLFGSFFELEDESCFTCIDGWIVTGSMKAVQEYVSGRALDYTLKQYMSDAGYTLPQSGRKSSLISYYSFTEDQSFTESVLTPALLELVRPLYDDCDFCPMVMSVVKDRNGLSLSGEVAKLTMQKIKAPSFERDTVVIVPEGPFQVKNSGTGKMNTFYQNSHLSLCLRQDGKDLWGVPFKEPLCGTAYNVDYYANGKLQIIFGAGSRIYLIDRLGRYVTGFPVDLKKDILLGPDVYDFNGTRKYNIMVLHKDNTIEMYNLKGQRPSSWKTIAPSETVKKLPERVVVGGNSFWVVRTSVQTLIYPFYGGSSVTTFAGDQMIRPDSEVKVIDATSVEVSCYDGKSRTVVLK